MKKLFIALLIVCSLFTFKTISASAEETIENQAMINYADDVDNPIFDDCVYEEYISLDSDLRSDLVLLKAPFGDLLNSAENQSNYNHIITFANAYDKIENGLNREIVFYVYQREFISEVGDFMCFDSVIQSIDGEVTGDKESMQIGVVLSKYENIYKVVLTNRYLMTKPIFFLRDVLLNKENTIFNVTNLYNMKTSNTENLRMSIQQEFNFISALDNTARSTNTIRTSTCIVRDTNSVIADGKLGYLRFDDIDGFNVLMGNYTENTFRLYFYFFDVYEDGEKWTNTKKLKSVEYYYSEEYISDWFYYWNDSLVKADYKQYSNLTDNILANVDSNEKTMIYPLDSTYNMFFAFTDSMLEKEKLIFDGVWNIEDNDFLDDLKNASNYDKNIFTDYTFGMLVGNENGYEDDETNEYGFDIRDFKVVNKRIRHDYTEVELESLVKINYEEYGVMYCVYVDETYVENVGMIGEKEEFEEFIGDIETIEPQLPNLLELLNINKDKDNGIPTWLKVVILIASILLLIFIWNRIIYPIIRILRKRKY